MSLPTVSPVQSSPVRDSRKEQQTPAYFQQQQQHTAQLIDLTLANAAPHTSSVTSFSQPLISASAPAAAAVALTMLTRSFHARSSSRHSTHGRTSSPFPHERSHLRQQSDLGRPQYEDVDLEAGESEYGVYERGDEQDDNSEAASSPPLSPPQFRSHLSSRQQHSSPSSTLWFSSSPSSPPSFSVSPTAGYIAEPRDDWSSAASPPFQWARLGLSSLLSSVQTKLPFLASSFATSAPATRSTVQSSSAGKRKRAKPQCSQRWVTAAEATDSVVIDVRVPDTRYGHGGSSSKQYGGSHSSRMHVRQSSVSAKKRKVIHVVIEHSNRDQQQTRQTRQSGSAEAVRDTGRTTRAVVRSSGSVSMPHSSIVSASRPLLPLSSGSLDQPPPSSSASRPPLPRLPACFPALDRHASSCASGALQRLSESVMDDVERQLEADVYRSLSSVDAAIQCELDTLLAAHGMTAPQGTLSFRQLVLRILDASSSDRRLRKLCAMEPQWAVYVLETLRCINYGQDQHAATAPATSTVAASQRSKSRNSECVQEEWTVQHADPLSAAVVPVRARRRTVSHVDSRRRESGRESREIGRHRRVTSEGAVAASRWSSSPLLLRRSNTASRSFPHTFSLFVSSASGISYSLRPCSVSASSSSHLRLLDGRSSFVQSCLGSATSVHVLLATLLYVSLLHTTDSACLRKRHFALAVLHHPSFQADRPRLPLSHPQAAERARRVASREKEYCRELYYMIDSCCLSLIQHEMLPALPLRTFHEHTLPELPIAHSLGLR